MSSMSKAVNISEIINEVIEGEEVIKKADELKVTPSWLERKIIEFVSENVDKERIFGKLLNVATRNQLSDIWYAKRIVEFGYSNKSDICLVEHISSEKYERLYITICPYIRDSVLKAKKDIQVPQNDQFIRIVRPHHGACRSWTVIKI